MMIVLAVMFELEHISAGLLAGFNPVMKGKYIGLLRHFLVWEYTR